MALSWVFEYHLGNFNFIFHLFRGTLPLWCAVVLSTSHVRCGEYSGNKWIPHEKRNFDLCFFDVSCCSGDFLSTVDRSKFNCSVGKERR